MSMHPSQSRSLSDSIHLEKCVRCLGEGTVVVDRWEDEKGWPCERFDKCPKCDGRTYKLPSPGLYLVKVPGFGDDNASVARVLETWAEFIGADWDLSCALPVEWLRKVAELDGSAPL